MKNTIIAVSMLTFSAYAYAEEAFNEAHYNAKFCCMVKGETEVQHKFKYAGDQSSHVMMDCETKTHVYEGGLDKRSSLDSLQQALFFSVLTNKKPAVVIYDTDGKLGRFEYRIKTACEKAGVEFLNPKEAELVCKLSP